MPTFLKFLKNLVILRPTPNYNTDTQISRSELSKMIGQAKKSKEWSEVEEFYSQAFSNCANLCATFKQDPEQNGAKMEDPELKMDLLNYTLDKIESLSGSVQKGMLKSIVTCLLDLESHPLLARDLTRALFILLQNPIFSSQSTYTVFAHLLQQLTSLANSDHQYLVHWFRTLSQTRIRSILRNLLQFVTIRQFPPADKSLPPLSKSRWWIPTATKVLALLNAANNIGGPQLVEYTEFYNVSLDHMDLMAEYYAWQNPDRPGQFSYCQVCVYFQTIAFNFSYLKLFF